jgi:NAD(P)-dependent dehydrogenase (short-subunit alcohol dehydrogenase family)
MGLNSYFDLSGKTALVTGGSKGLGKSFALALAEAGADVAIASRSLGDLAKVKDDIESLDRQAFAIKVDITKEEQVAAMVQETV